MKEIKIVDLEIIEGKQCFQKIVIDGRDLLQEFELSLEERYRSEMRTLYSWMQMVALCTRDIVREDCHHGRKKE